MSNHSYKIYPSLLDSYTDYLNSDSFGRDIGEIAKHRLIHLNSLNLFNSNLLSTELIEFLPNGKIPRRWIKVPLSMKW